MTYRHWLRIGLLLGGAPFCLLLGTTPAAADGNDLVLARTLFNEGRKLAAAGKYGDACPKFEESNRLNPGIGTGFNLADCWDHVGRTASAWAKYLDVAASAQVAHQSDREKVARDRAAALEPQLSRLTIEVHPGASGTEIKNDGVVVGKALWGTAIPIDPGEHTIEATAPSKKPWKAVVQVAPRGGKAAVVVPQLEEDRAAAPAAAVATPGNEAPATGSAAGGGAPAGSDSASTSSTTVRTIGFVVGGAGVVGIATGVVFGLQLKAKNDEAKAICPSGMGCTAAERADHDARLEEARNARLPTYIAFAAGGAALITGVVLVVTSSMPSAGPVTSAPRLEVAPAVARGELGFQLAGRW